MDKKAIKKLKKDAVAVDCTVGLFAAKDICKASSRLRKFISQIENGELEVTEKKKGTIS